MRFHSKAIMLATLLLSGITTTAQAQSKPQILVGENILVSAKSETRPATEPQLAVDPMNPNHLVGVAIFSSEPPFGQKENCAAFSSFDGGRTWTQHDFDVPGCADPWVVLRADETAVFTALSRGRLWVGRSSDGGRTWAQVPVDFGGGQDHGTMTVDASGGPRSGTIYLATLKGRRSAAGRPLASVFVARSADGGKTFAPPTNIITTNLNSNTQNPGVLSDGTLIVPYVDFQNNVDDFRGAGMLERKRIWILASSDGGQSFSYPMFVTEACSSLMQSFAIDASATPSRDRLYLACTDRDRKTILIHYSSDRGEKWSAPVRVDQSPGEVVFRRTPNVAVNKDGIVGVTWYERRKDAEKECQHLYFAASFDGGKTFLPQVRVSNAPSCPDTPANGESARRWPAGGDYSGLAAVPDGTFHVLWSDSRDGLYRLLTATITVQSVEANK